jgi:hypothetical protein
MGRRAASLLALLLAFGSGLYFGFKVGVSPFGQKYSHEIRPKWSVAPDGFFWQTLSSANQDICLCPPYEKGCTQNEGILEVDYKSAGQTTRTEWIVGIFLDKRLYAEPQCVTKRKGERLTFRILTGAGNSALLTLR